MEFLLALLLIDIRAMDRFVWWGGLKIADFIETAIERRW